ncbi:MAG: 5-formyltetrahydrofolate cyclo-ligase [Arenimonas sp.]
MSAHEAGAPDDAQSRQALRRELRQRRNAASPSERMAAAEAVASAVRAHSRFPGAGYVAGYWAMHGEVPLHLLQMRLGEGLVWCLPCIQPDDSLLFGPWRPGDPLVSNRFGIPEPELSMESLLPASKMALIVLPLLGYTRAGDRLGMGGGFYDRSLGFRRNTPAPPWLVGAGYAFQELPALVHQPWDVRLDAIATEHGVFDA